jgi:hypothetical protein
VAPLFDGGRRSVAYVLFEELLYGVVGFGGSSTSLPRGKGLSLIGKPDVALDRGEADAEEAGSMGLGHAALVDGLDYLSSEVFGVGFHPPMIVRGSSILSYAVVHYQETFWAMDRGFYEHCRKDPMASFGQLVSGTTTHYPLPLLKVH